MTSPSSLIATHTDLIHASQAPGARRRGRRKALFSSLAYALVLFTVAAVILPRHAVVAVQDDDETAAEDTKLVMPPPLLDRSPRLVVAPAVDVPSGGGDGEGGGVSRRNSRSKKTQQQDVPGRKEGRRPRRRLRRPRRRNRVQGFAPADKDKAVSRARLLASLPRQGRHRGESGAMQVHISTASISIDRVLFPSAQTYCTFLGVVK